MTPQQILVVAVRLFAIFWFFVSIDHLMTAVRTLNRFGPDEFATFNVLLPILELSVCAFLWFFPSTLSRRLLPGGESPSEAPGPVLLEWQAMLIAVLGLWMLAYAISDATYWITYIFAYTSSGPKYQLDDVLVDQWPYIAATIVELGIAGWLLLGAPKVAALLLRLRESGLRK